MELKTTTIFLKSKSKDTKNRIVVTRGKGWRGLSEMGGVKSYGFSVIKYLSSG